MTVCIRIDEFCISNEEFCISNDGFCRAAAVAVCLVARGATAWTGGWCWRDGTCVLYRNEDFLMENQGS